MSGSDTLRIEKFDSKGNQTFEKIFPVYGISQILGWEYDEERLTKYTWSHSNSGFVESEYEYDESGNVVDIYSYRLKGHKPAKDLMSYSSIEELKSSNEFRTYREDGERFLKASEFYDNSQKERELQFQSEARTDTIIYTYKSGLLISKKNVYGHNGAFNELIYTYDSDGNETSWMKVFSSGDTSAVYEKEFNDGLLTKVVATERGKLASTTTYQYKKGRLKTMTKTNDKGVEKMKETYYYRKDGRIDYVDKVNKYMGQVKRTHYYYWQ